LIQISSYRNGSTDSSKYQSIASNLKDISQSARQEAKNNLGTVVDAVSGLKGTTTDHPSHLNLSQQKDQSKETAGDASQGSIIVSNLVCTT
jgi:hypothetical protein